jgi:hypothetical protein
LNVTTTASLAPALDAPNTTITLVADDMVQDAAAAPPTVAAQAPPCAEVMKLAPVTVTELDWYPASGVNVDAVGVASTTNPLLVT